MMIDNRTAPYAALVLRLGLITFSGRSCPIRSKVRIQMHPSSAIPADGCFVQAMITTRLPGIGELHESRSPHAVAEPLSKSLSLPLSRGTGSDHSSRPGRKRRGANDPWG